MAEKFGYFIALIYSKAIDLSPIFIAMILINYFYFDDSSISKISSIKKYELPDEITLKGLKIEDGNGNIVYSIGPSKDDFISQSFFDNQGNRKIGVSVGRNKYAALSIYDNNSQARLNFSVIENNNVMSPKMNMRDKNGNLVTSIRENPGSWSGLYFYNNKKLGAFIGGIREDGTKEGFINSVSTYDEDGKLSGEMISSKTGGKIALFDKKGIYRNVAYVASDNSSGFMIKNNKGEDAFFTITDADGKIQKFIYRTPGEKAWGTISNIVTGAGILDKFTGGRK